MSGEHLDLSSEPPRENASSPATTHFLGIHFACCGVYSRIFPNTDCSAFVGHCPKCVRPVRIAIAPGGSTERFFTAY